MKRVLLSGGCGFLGSHLCKILAPTTDLTVVDNLSNSKRTALHGLPLTFKPWSCWSRPSLRLMREGNFNTIIHLAANAYIPTSVEAPLKDFTTNLLETVRLLEAVRTMPRPPKVMLFSSAAVLGACSGTMTEHQALRPISPYGASKAGVEHYGRVYAETYHLPIQIVRLFPLYGPGQRKQVVYDLMNKCASPKQRSLSVIGTGQEVRDLLYVEDAAAIIHQMAIHAPFDGSVLQLCSGKGTSIATLAHLLLQHAPTAKPIVYTQKLRAGDAPRMVGSRKDTQAYRTKPFTTLSEGLQKTWDWFRALNETTT